jgi:hypothetical protein
VGENRRHSRGLGWGAPVSGPQFLAFRLLRGGFLAPVSGGDFLISVSGVQRPVRQQTESRLHPPRTSPVTDSLSCSTDHDHAGVLGISVWGRVSGAGLCLDDREPAAPSSSGLGARGPPSNPGVPERMDDGARPRKGRFRLP